MFHTEIFSSSIPNSGAGNIQQLNYFTAQSYLTPQQNGVQVALELPNIMFAAGVGAHLCNVRLQANSMLPLPYISLAPNNRGGAFESPPRCWDFSGQPIPLIPTEEQDVFVSQNSGGAETEYVLVSWCSGPPTPIPVNTNVSRVANLISPVGRYIAARFTTVATTSAGAWSNLQPVFDQNLLAGFYAVVGARVLSTTGLFFRLQFTVSSPFRPGGICVQSYDQMDPPNQRYMDSFGLPQIGWGTWATFYQNVPPVVQIFTTGADTNPEGELDLIYLGGQVTQGL
jgi:hypothetical protein